MYGLWIIAEIFEGGKASFWMSENDTRQVHFESFLPKWRVSKFSLHMVYMYADDTTICYIGDSVYEVLLKFNKALEKLVICMV